MNKRAVGAVWEQNAAQYLADRGMKILERNYRNRQGEIDIIGRHEGYLVFVEVKYRGSLEKGYASEAVDGRKQRQICRVSDYYRYTHGLEDDTAVRFDVVAVQGDRIEWLQDAFSYLYPGS